MEVHRNQARHIFFSEDDSDEAPVLEPIAPVIEAQPSSSDTDAYDVAAYCVEAGIPVPKKAKATRGKKAIPAKWKEAQVKQTRLAGKPYVGKAGAVDKRRMGAACLKPYCQSAGNKCRDVSERERAAIHLAFWRLPSWSERQTYIQGCTDTISEGPSRVRNAWFLKTQDGRRHRVCRNLVSTTLGVAERTLTRWLGRKPSHGPKNSKAPKSGSTAPIADDDEQFLRAWIELIPTVPSHYCRHADSYINKKFLEPGTSIAGLHREFLEAARREGKRLISDCYFTNTFKELGFHAFIPKKDQCSTCLAGRNRSIPPADFEEHKRAAEEAKQERKKDELRATRDPTVAVFTMDLQAVTCLPRTQASTMFYKTKLQLHNMVFFCKNTKDGHCFLYDETDGDLKSNCFSYIQRRFLETILQKPEYGRVKEVIIWSDNCGYQNKCAGIASGLLFVAIKRNIKILQKYLIKGHTMMEVDSVHATIQRNLKHLDLLVPRDFELAARTARRNPRPYAVTRLHFQDFMKLENPYCKTIRPPRSSVNELRALLYHRSGRVAYKLNFQQRWQELDIQIDLSNKNVVMIFQERLKISERKFNDLMSLKAVIPNENHNFYDNLPHE